MKAAVYEEYGDADVLEIREIARPEPGDDAILVQVYAAAVTTGDWRLRAAAFPGIMALPGRLMFGIRRPRNPVLGTAFSGRVVARGRNVTRFRPGDAVFGFSGSRAHAEYVAVDAGGPVALKPDNIAHDEAAAVPFGGLSALVFVRDVAAVKPGARVLVNGASGGVGAYAVQLAKHLGAEVTGVAGAGNLDLVRSLGADRVLDYRAGDIAAAAGRCDVVIDTVGRLPWAAAKRILGRTGRYVPLEFAGREIGRALLARLAGGPRVLLAVSGDTREDLEVLAGLLAGGALRAVVDSRFPLGGIAAAHRRVETRHATGAVVVTMDGAAARQAAA
ncbi:MAG: NAD(P)-dependent alcohol dehydrogenase [Oricola sp.]